MGFVLLHQDLLGLGTTTYYIYTGSQVIAVNTNTFKREILCLGSLDTNHCYTRLDVEIYNLLSTLHAVVERIVSQLTSLINSESSIILGVALMLVTLGKCILTLGSLCSGFLKLVVDSKRTSGYKSNGL